MQNNTVYKYSYSTVEIKVKLLCDFKQKYLSTKIKI